MRLALALLALAACAESDLDRLEGLLASHPKVCAEYEDGYTSHISSDEMLACMNDAYATGTLALTRSSRQDAYGFYVDTFLIAVDHQVRIFERNPDGDDGSPGEPSARERPTCTGPFHLGTPDTTGFSALIVEGCP